MAHNKYILGVFDDDDVMLKAAKNIKAAGVKINDVMTPFPIHGLDPVLGLKDTRLHTLGFIFGATGGILMFLYITWIFVVDYPMIIGGKPYFSVPAWVPVMFEVTVLSASVSMVVAFFIRSGLSAIKKQTILDPRITDDKFIIVFRHDKRTDEELNNIKKLLADNGASEVNEKTIV